MTKHDSQRGWFAYELYQQMKANENIWLLTGDLGYKAFDSIMNNFKGRFVNVGAAETSLIDIAVGLALEGKIPFVYSITPFLLYRPFESIRNYVNREIIPVKLIGAGRDQDYLHDGFSHWAEEDRYIMKLFKGIKSYWPETKEEIPAIVREMVKKNKPYYLNLRR